MNKSELINQVQKFLGGEAECSKAFAEKAINAVLDGIRVGLRDHKSIQLVGFGSWEVVKRAARTGVNPRTGEKLKIKASKTVKFRPGSALKELVA